MYIYIYILYILFDYLWEPEGNFGANRCDGGGSRVRLGSAPQARGDTHDTYIYIYIHI